MEFEIKICKTSTRPYCEALLNGEPLPATIKKETSKPNDEKTELTKAALSAQETANFWTSMWLLPF